MSAQGINIDPSSSYFRMIPELGTPISPTPGWTYGNLNLMGGRIKLQFTPLQGTGLVSRLGRNGACLSEIRRLTRAIPEIDMRRSVRILLRKRKIKPTTEWFDENVRRDNHGEIIPILDLCTKTDSLLTLPLGRALHQRSYEIFSVHTLIDEEGFTMSFQVWKPYIPPANPGPAEPEAACVNDASGLLSAEKSEQSS